MVVGWVHFLAGKEEAWAHMLTCGSRMESKMKWCVEFLSLIPRGLKYETPNGEAPCAMHMGELSGFLLWSKQLFRSDGWDSCAFDISMEQRLIEESRVISIKVMVFLLIRQEEVFNGESDRCWFAWYMLYQSQSKYNSLRWLSWVFLLFGGYANNKTLVGFARCF